MGDNAMILWNVEQFDYSALTGYQFDTFRSISNDFYYKNTDYQIFGQNIWWKQLGTQYNPGYSVFDELGISTKTTEGQLGVDSLTFLRFTRNDSPGTYWMILPKIVDNPFKDFSPQINQYGDPSPQFIITTSDLSESPQTFQALASTQYQSQVFWKDREEPYSIHDLLASSVRRCISECRPIPYGIKDLLNRIFPSFPIDIDVQRLGPEDLEGYRFALPESISGNIYYTNHNNSGKTILAEHIWWKQLNIPRSTYSVFKYMSVPTQSTDTQVGVDTLNFIRFQPKNQVDSTYWMILPK